MNMPTFIAEPPQTHAPLNIPVEPTTATRDHAERRERIASRALQGLLAATPAATQSTTNADAYAKRAVRYADALIEVLNTTTAEAIHARSR